MHAEGLRFDPAYLHHYAEVLKKMAFGRVLCFSRLDAAKRSLTIYQAEIKKEFKNKKTRVLETLQARNKEVAYERARESEA